jgi:hypothetical protein
MLHFHKTIIVFVLGEGGVAIYVQVHALHD